MITVLHADGNILFKKFNFFISLAKFCFDRASSKLYTNLYIFLLQTVCG